MPNAYIVYNPSAGRFPSQLLTERAAKVLQEHDWQVQLVRTTGGPHITQTARSVNSWEGKRPAVGL